MPPVIHRVLFELAIGVALVRRADLRKSFLTPVYSQIKISRCFHFFPTSILQSLLTLEHDHLSKQAAWRAGVRASPTPRPTAKSTSTDRGTNARGAYSSACYGRGCPPPSPLFSPTCTSPSPCARGCRCTPTSRASPPRCARPFAANIVSR